MKNRVKSFVSFGAATLLAFGAVAAQVNSATHVTISDPLPQVPGAVATVSQTNPDPRFPGAWLIDSSGNYRGEVRQCMSGLTQQDRATCLQEARNAHAAKMRGNLNVYGNHEANALARCEVHMTAENRAACQARVMGMGTIEGSVAGGGLLREVETVVLPDSGSVTIVPQTSDPVVLVPSTNTMGNR